jgi:hypothetical protein
VTGSADATADSGKNVLLVPDVSKFRLPTVHVLDLHVSRPVQLFGCTFRVDVDVFNIANLATPLAKFYDVRSAFFDIPSQLMDPATVRIGVRFDIK